MSSSSSNSSIFAQLLSASVSSRMVENMSKLLASTIRLAPKTKDSPQIPFLSYFIGSLVDGSRISAAVFHIALIYIRRLQKVLPSSALGMACTGHRIALAAIIIAEKFVCDVPMKNAAWFQHARCFSLPEINTMERQLLALLVSFLYHAISHSK